MARLPSGRYLIQQTGGMVILFEEHLQEEIFSYDVTSREAMTAAQASIIDSDLSMPDKCAACFWCGYFYGVLVAGDDHLYMEATENDLTDDHRP